MPDWYSFAPNLNFLSSIGLQGYMAEGMDISPPGTDSHGRVCH